MGTSDTATRRQALGLLTALPLAACGARLAPSQSFARRLAAHYPVRPQLGYVNALIGDAQRRLAPSAALPQLLRDAAQAALPLSDWPRLAGFALLADAARHAQHEAAGRLSLQALDAVLVDTAQGPQLRGLRPWTDDMFMASLLLNHVAPLLAVEARQRARLALGRALQTLAARLQRPDGLFEHAVGSAVAWGRGNGFAALALALALDGLLPPTDSALGAELLQSLQAYLQRLLFLQGGDGLWRQVLDQPAAGPELTVTAMNLQVLCVARRQGWLPAAQLQRSIGLAWDGLLRRVDLDAGTFRDVCASTPAGPDLAFYLQRPIVNGRDERAAAFVLQAALGMAERA